MRTFKTPEDKTDWEHEAVDRLSDLEQKILQSQHSHYKLTSAIGIKAVDQKLSIHAYRLWIYLCSLFPFGDRSVDMPTQAELALRLGVSVRSILRAAAELDEANLWSFRVEKWKGRNLTGHKRDDKSVTPDDRIVTPDDKPVTQSDRIVTPCHLEPLPSAGSGTPQTIQTIQTISDLSLSSLSHLQPDKTEREIQELQEENLITWIGKQNKTAQNPRAYALTCLNGDRSYWELAYRQFQESKDRATVPVLPDSNHSASLEISNRERLERCQGLWMSVRSRKRVEKEIKAHPEWGLEITELGVQPVALALPH
jgi:hypothetical protein